MVPPIREQRIHVLIARLVIVVGSIAMAWPIVGGGWRYSGDHAPHVAEILELANNRSGWSDLAFAGFPVGSLHSPLGYGFLAWLVRLGVPAWAGYVTALALSEVALGLALLETLRRHTSLPLALLFAIAGQTQAILVVGPSGLMVGMWTYGLAIAALIVLFDRLHEPWCLRRAAEVSALVGLIGLTHSIVVYGVVLVVLIRCIALALRGALAEALGIGASAALGAVASAGYWLGASLTLDTADIRSGMPFGPVHFQTFLRPLLDEGFRPDRILFDRSAVLADLVLWVGAGLGLTRLRVAHPAQRELFGTAALVMIVSILLVGHIGSLQHAALFGPIPWRIMVSVRPLAAFLALQALPPPRSVVTSRLALVVVILAAADWYGAERRLVRSDAVPQETPEGQQMAALTSALRALPRSEGRIYVQNTHGLAPNRLALGHGATLLQARTGHRTVGAYYSLVPFATDTWLSTFVGPLVGLPPTAANRTRIEARLDALGADRVLACHPSTITELTAWGYPVLLREGVFTLFERPAPGLIRASSDTRVTGVTYHDGALRFTTENPRRHEVLIAVSYSRRFRVTRGRAAIAKQLDGLMRVLLPGGRNEIAIEFQAPQWTWWLSAVGWVVIGLLAVASRRRARRG